LAKEKQNSDESLAPSAKVVGAVNLTLLVLNDQRHRIAASAGDADPLLRRRGKVDNSATELTPS
jgi:hypothetical protein